MAREQGQRSFAAEQISFVNSGSYGKNGSPWSYIQRRIPKNIMISAYRNPMSLEELCMEMGIAMPYMEEEVKLLADQTLLKEWRAASMRPILLSWIRTPKPVFFISWRK